MGIAQKPNPANQSSQTTTVAAKAPGARNRVRCIWEQKRGNFPFLFIYNNYSGCMNLRLVLPE